MIQQFEQFLQNYYTKIVFIFAVAIAVVFALSMETPQ